MDEVVKRLDRFEDKLDKLASAVLTIARIEERQAQHGRTVERIWSAVEKLTTRVEALEKAGVKQTVKVNFGERMFWSIVTAGLGMLAFYLKFGG